MVLVNTGIGAFIEVIRGEMYKWSVSHIVVVIIQKSMLRVSLLKGLWQVPYGGHIAARALWILIHINKLHGRGLQKYQVYFNMK